MESPTPQPAPGSATFMEGCKDSLPIVISYIPVAFAFGLNATRLGFSPLESVFFSCIIYAGASQFVITAMLAAGSSLWVAALTVMAMDVRHVLYGPSLRSRIIQRLQKSKTALWAFGLTDEVFAAATAKLVTAALVGALAGVTLFSIPVAILAGIVCGCLTALIQAFWQGAPDEL
ncbi:AzlC family ABC transporter permease [Escherichia coli]